MNIDELVSTPVFRRGTRHRDFAASRLSDSFFTNSVPRLFGSEPWSRGRPFFELLRNVRVINAESRPAGWTILSLTAASW